VNKRACGVVPFCRRSSQIVGYPHDIKGAGHLCVCQCDARCVTQMKFVDRQSLKQFVSSGDWSNVPRQIDFSWSVKGFAKTFLALVRSWRPYSEGKFAAMNMINLAIQVH